MKKLLPVLFSGALALSFSQIAAAQGSVRVQPHGQYNSNTNTQIGDGNQSTQQQGTANQAQNTQQSGAQNQNSQQSGSRTSTQEQK